MWQTGPKFPVCVRFMYDKFVKEIFKFVSMFRQLWPGQTLKVQSQEEALFFYYLICISYFYQKNGYYGQSAYMQTRIQVQTDCVPMNTEQYLSERIGWEWLIWSFI